MSAFERIIKRRKVDALITLRPELTDRELGLIHDHSFPCVALLLAKSQSKTLYSCLSDSEYGSQLAGEFFGQFPEYTMMYIGSDDDVDESRSRCNGFRRGLARRGRELSAENILSCRMSFPYAADFAEKMVPRLTGTKTAIFTYNDILALGVMEALKKHGVSVPGCVQVIGMDDIPLAGWNSPHLSTLHVPLEDMVPGACGMIRSLIEGRDITGPTRVYQPHLVTRETTLKVRRPDVLHF